MSPAEAARGGYHSSMPLAPTRLPRAVFLMACLVFALAARGAELQPRSYAWLLSHATVVAAGTVQGVSSGMFSDGRSATVSVDGIIKGKLRARVGVE